MTAQEFTTTYYRYAYRAAAPRGYNPLYLLAQAAFESGWANETHRKIRAFAGVTAGGKWKGATFKTPKITLRVYPNFWLSFDDHADLFYRNRNGMYSAVHAALLRNSPDDFAHAVAYSPYITELNGDNRPAYKAGVLLCYNQIKKYEPLIPFMDMEALAGLGLVGLLGYGFYRVVSR